MSIEKYLQSRTHLYIFLAILSIVIILEVVSMSGEKVYERNTVVRGAKITKVELAYENKDNVEIELSIKLISILSYLNRLDYLPYYRNNLIECSPITKVYFDNEIVETITLFKVIHENECKFILSSLHYAYFEGSSFFKEIEKISGNVK